jgi:methyltransferase
MPDPTTILHGYLVLLALERGAELAISRRNARWALSAGGVEAGGGHYPAMVAFHAAVLLACAVEPLLWPRSWPTTAAIAFLAVALLAQALRWWAILTLGWRWNTRIIVLPGAPPVVGGPYRLLAHPNYLAVALELLAVPLIGGALVTAALATLGNGLLLALRIPAEERALGLGWARARPGEPAVTARELAVSAEIVRLAGEDLRLDGELPGPDEPLAGRLDSLRLLALVVAVEDRFRVRLTDDDAAQARTLHDLARLVAARSEEPSA